MTAVTGAPETWLVELHQGLAGIEDLDKQLSAVAPMRGGVTDTFEDDLVPPSRTTILTYNPEWS